MQKYFYYFATCVCIILVLCVSCNHNMPSSVSHKELTCESTLELLLEYFPTFADTPFIYINDHSGEQYNLSPCFRNGVLITPSIPAISDGGENTNIAPKSILEKHTLHRVSDGKEVWLHDIYVFFRPDGLSASPANTTYLYGTIRNSLASDSFLIAWRCYICMNQVDRKIYTSFADCDTAMVWNLLTDTLKFRLNGSHDIPEEDNTKPYVLIVKGKGIYDFSLDGQSIWRRTDVTSK